MYVSDRGFDGFSIYCKMYADCKLGLTSISKNGTAAKLGFAIYIWSNSMPDPNAVNPCESTSTKLGLWQ